ncbi:alpha-E domain-containing protein [Brooklawnia cerclae]|uniref:Alpha-E superfamily protein n=1 Tax=Brooklawnia cerclae TaxID=349934 RepID=A0ABX0SEK0_9ACTN|nr:alpha-E domain-containing protein [Brooklawnia cerclae]NIH56809.1 putative alpha-E superfamily protein [Brooklawnia cerclae]
MLSRIADSLFWIGRYLERAEDTSRIVGVHLQRFAEDPTVDERVAPVAILAAMGVDPQDLVHERVDMGMMLERLCYDPDSPTSTRAVLRAAREAARRVRDVISPELWEAINAAYHEFMAPSFTSMRPTAALQLMRTRCVQIAGIADSLMTRDEAYHFLVLGRYLERVDMSSRSVSTVPDHGDQLVAWTVALRACGGFHAFTRTYAGAGDAVDAARFLIVDRRFPRSLVHGMQAVQDALAELDPINVNLRLDPTARIIARVRSWLEYMDPAELVIGLEDRMERVQTACAEVSDQVFNRYFEGPGVVAWHKEVTVCD